MSTNEDLYKQVKMLENFKGKYEKKILSLKNDLKATEMLLSDTENQILEIYNKMEEDRLVLNQVKSNHAQCKNTVFEIIDTRDSKNGINLSEILVLAQEHYKIKEDNVIKYLEELVNEGRIYNPRPNTFRVTSKGL